MLIGIKRIYEKTDFGDGKRILVDRLWPRGMRRSSANIDTWMKDIAPSESLRKWYAHDPAKWKTFERRYRRELERNPALISLVKKALREDVTLIYAARDMRRNNAVVLANVLRVKIRKLKAAENMNGHLAEAKMLNRSLSGFYAFLEFNLFEF